MAEIDNYPALVDAIWEIVQGTPEERERIDFLFSEQQIAGKLGITYIWDSDPCVFGVAQALNDLVALGYCEGVGNFNGHRWMNVSPSADSPDMLPSANLIAPPLPKLPPLRRKALQFIQLHFTLKKYQSLSRKLYQSCYLRLMRWRLTRPEVH